MLRFQRDVWSAVDAIAQKSDKIASSAGFPSNHLPLESHMEGPADNYSASETSTSSCVYERDDLLCIYWWLDFKEASRRCPQSTQETESSDIDGSSEDEFSPYLFNV